MEPITRKEKYLAKAAGEYSGETPEPVTREEIYLDKIAKGGGGGSVDAYTKAETDALLDEKQDALTSTQLSAINSGIDSTKVAQIETNTSAISDLQAIIGDINSVLEEVL